MSAHETRIVLRPLYRGQGRDYTCEVHGCPHRAEFAKLWLRDSGVPSDAQTYCATHARAIYPAAAGAIDDGAGEAEVDGAITSNNTVSWRVSWTRNLGTEDYDSYEEAAAAIRDVHPEAVGEWAPDGPTEVWWASAEDRESDGDGEDPYVRTCATITRCEESSP